jgi:hypothetical protein
LFARAVGGENRATLLTIHEYLAEDHARLDALLATAVANPQRIDDESYRAFRGGLLRHIAMEEKVLFADARTHHRDAFDDLIRILHADHAAIASLLVPPPSPALIRTLQSVLAEHNPLEETADGLYERCDRSAGDRAPVLIARMQAIAPVRASLYVDEPRIYEHIERMLAAREDAKRGR